MQDTLVVGDRHDTPVAGDRQDTPLAVTGRILQWWVMGTPGNPRKFNSKFAISTYQ